jgi:hypothetical protein
VAPCYTTPRDTQLGSVPIGSRGVAQHGATQKPLWVKNRPLMLPVSESPNNYVENQGD